MYRKFIPNNNYLSCSEQRKKALDAPKDEYWCNFLCQKFLPKESFITTKDDRVNINLCGKCYNSYVLAKKFIKKGKITLEQYKEDPNIVYQKYETPVIDKIMECVECKTAKTIDKFDAKRNVCKACRLIQATERTQKDIDVAFSEIEKLKEDSNKLLFYVKRMPLDKIREVLKHYGITRTSKDKKDDMVAKIINHFEKHASPYMCRGNCGFKLQEEFAYCNDCKKTNGNKKSIEQRNHEFKQNIDEFMENLYEIKPEDAYAINGFCLYAIMEKLEIKLKKYTKPQMIELINETLKPKRENLDKNKNLVEVKPELQFIESTYIGKAENKKVDDWSMVELSKELVSKIERELLEQNFKTGEYILQLTVKRK